MGDIAVNSPRVEYGQFDPATDIPANSTAKVTISTTVAANATPGTYTATPEGYTTAAGDETFSPTSIGFTVLGPDADLAVGLNATPAPLLSNAILYIQTATNNGPATVSSGTVTTTLPAQTTGVTGLPANCAYNNTAKTVACTDTGLTASATATHTFTAHLNLLSLGALPASATRTTSSPADPNPANDTAGANCTALTGLIITC